MTDATPHPASAWRARFLKAFGSFFPAAEWPEARLDRLLAFAQYRDMEAGETLLREGQVCAGVPFVIEGAIRVFKVAESGREITLYRIEAGESCILSVGCGLSVKAFPASVVVERPTSAVFLPAETLRRLLAESEPFRDYVLDQYSNRMVDIMLLVEEVAFRKVDERLAQWLAEHAKGGSRARSAGFLGQVETTHQELADNIGTSREVISRILKDWEDRGLLRLNRGSVALLPAFETLLPP